MSSGTVCTGVYCSTVGLWKRLTIRNRTSRLRNYEVQRHIAWSLLPVKGQVKQHCDEINGNSYSTRNHIRSLNVHHSFSILSVDRSKASSKTMPPYSAMQSLLLQMRISSPVLKSRSPSSKSKLLTFSWSCNAQWFYETYLSRTVWMCVRSKVWLSRWRLDVCQLWLVSEVQIDVSAMSRSLVQGSPTECVYVPLSVVRCNIHPLQLQRVRRNGQRNK